MPEKFPHYFIKTILGFTLWTAGITWLGAWASADVYINVMAVNGAEIARETPIKFTLPSEIKPADVLETDGLKLDYDVTQGGYFLTGSVSLDSKASKTFRIRVRDTWKTSDEEIDQIKKQINEGLEKIAPAEDKTGKAEVLKNQLVNRLDYIIAQENNSEESVEKRIGSYRTYVDQLNEIRRNSLSVDYWRSEPGETLKPKLIRMIVEVENPLDKAHTVKEQQFLPKEVKPENVIEREGFDIRYDESQQRSFLFKEEELQAKEKKRYSIGIEDIWLVPQVKLDYLKNRSDKAYDALKDTKYKQIAQFLYDRIIENLQIITDSQKEERDIQQHIGAFRVNQKVFENTHRDVEELERILALYREELEKTKVENVLQKVRVLNGVHKLSEMIFNKKPSPNSTWGIIWLVVLFVGGYTLLHFVVWTIKSSKDKKIQKVEENSPAAEKTTGAKT